MAVIDLLLGLQSRLEAVFADESAEAGSDVRPEARWPHPSRRWAWQEEFVW